MMYEAVIAMLSEGRDIHSLKVLDITKRAGIGKGTAYEYFQSKEELIAEALDWNFRSQMEELNVLVEVRKSFREKVYILLDWMEKTVPEKKTFMEMLGTSSNSCYVSTDMKCRMKRKQYRDLILESVQDILNTGVEEGIIAPEESSYNQEMALMSQLIMFFLYLTWEKEAGAEDVQAVKSQTYENILKLYR